jgi:hypothetical protein
MRRSAAVTLSIDGNCANIAARDYFRAALHNLGVPTGPARRRPSIISRPFTRHCPAISRSPRICAFSACCTASRRCARVEQLLHEFDLLHLRHTKCGLLSSPAAQTIRAKIKALAAQAWPDAD